MSVKKFYLALHKCKKEDVDLTSRRVAPNIKPPFYYIFYALIYSLILYHGQLYIYY